MNCHGRSPARDPSATRGMRDIRGVFAATSKVRVETVRARFDSACSLGTP